MPLPLYSFIWLAVVDTPFGIIAAASILSEYGHRQPSVKQLMDLGPRNVPEAVRKVPEGIIPPIYTGYSMAIEVLPAGPAPGFNPTSTADIWKELWTGDFCPEAYLK